MNRSNTSATFRASFVALFLTVVACSSYAQFSGSGMGGGGMGGGRHRGGENSPAEKSATAPARLQNQWEQVNARLYDLRIQLMITHEQGPAWEKFRASLLELAAGRQTLPPNIEDQTAAAAAHLQKEAAQRRLDLTYKVDQAMQALVAALAPEQLRTADQNLPQLLADFSSGAAVASGPRPMSR